MGCWMPEGQKNKSQFYTAACLGQVEREAARRASSMLGCAGSSTAGSWREVILRFPQPWVQPGRGQQEGRASGARLLTVLYGRRMGGGDVGLVQSRYKESVFHPKDKQTLQQGPKNMVYPPSLEDSRPT